MNIDAFLEELNPELINWRRAFHQYPETGWTEYMTTYRIYKQLQALGLTVYTGTDAVETSARMGVPSDQELYAAEKRASEAGVPEKFLNKVAGGHTGVVAVLKTGKPGPHIACRFDIDALPIEESDTYDHVPAEKEFASSLPGSMHACAHDGHTAIGLGVATWLAKYRDELTGTYTLLFQPAEEGSRGAKAMVEMGWLDDVDVFLGGHIGIEDLTVGQVAATTEQFLATTKFDVHFKGTAAHAGKRPEQGKNALLAAAACAQHLHAIAPHSQGATRLNIGTLNAGTGRNIVPDQATLTGETRGETNALNDYVFQEAERIIHGSASLYDVEAEMKVVGKGTSAVCDQAFIRLLEQAATRSTAITEVLPVLSLGASEDVTHMMNRVQARGGTATYMIFGTPLPAGHHHPRFDYDEGVLKTGAAAFISLILECNQRGQQR
ncbi:amidohydrolase [Bacillus sp. H-16]|uniref:amidohydrolase n=1 Tax=Alteribacter salitolerans TaxID=2912333 RepID=UPI001962BA33|nr:amidohydrolase [Alteribacter salitolerans]MBM7097497.1 amidohydrolase [Alteribacter salitolerans]